MSSAKYSIVFDGGSRGNPGPAYGSFHIEPADDQAGETVRLSFRDGTNNEAEYWTLIQAVRTLLTQLEEEKTDPVSISIEIRGDSRLVIHQVGGRWKAKNPRMRALRDEALHLLQQFGSVRLVHQPRRETYRLLRH